MKITIPRQRSFQLRRGLIYLILLFVIITGYHLFYIVSYPGAVSVLFGYFNINLLWILISFTSILFIDFRLFNQYKHLTFSTIFIMLAFIAEVFYTYLKYRQGLRLTVVIGSSFLIPVMSYLYLYLFERKNGLRTILVTINICAFIWFIIMILQATMFKLKGHFLFEFLSYYSNENVKERDNGVRINAGIFSEFVLIFNFSAILNGKKRIFPLWLHMVIFITSAYCFVVITQSRGELMYLAVALSILFLTTNGDKKKKRWQIVLFFVFMGLVLSSGLISNLIDSFDTKGELGVSTSNRLYAFQYYFDCFKRSPFFGNGFLHTGPISPYYSIEHGVGGKAWYADVGYVGLLGNVGLMGFFFIGLPFIRIVYILVKLKDKMKLSEYSFEVAYCVYLLISSVTYLISERSLIIQFPFIIAYYEYIYRVYNRSVQEVIISRLRSM